MKNFTPTGDVGTGYEKVIVDEELEYDKSESLYVVTNSYITNNLNEDLKLVYNQTDEATDRQIRFMASRQMYNFVQYKKTWPGEWDKKKYLLNTIEENVDVLKRLIRSHIESNFVSERMKLVLESGIDFDAGKLIEGFNEDLEENQLAHATKQILGELIFFAYKTRVDDDVPDLGGI